MMNISMWHNGKKISDRIHTADHFMNRLFGLMGRDNLGDADGLLIKPCKQIHTYFMKFPLDVIFLSKSGEVMCIEKGMTPGKIGRYVKQAVMILETAEGFADLHGIKPQDIVLLGKDREGT